MDGSAHISETRQGKALARLAMLTERMVEMSVERAEESETADDFKVYSDACARHARSLRMTLALENRLMRDTEAHEAAHREHRQLQDKEARARRRQRLYEQLSEREDLDFLHEILAEESRSTTFLEEPIEHQLDRLEALLAEDEEAEESPTSPDAAASAGGGPLAEERAVEGESRTRRVATAPDDSS